MFQEVLSLFFPPVCVICRHSKPAAGGDLCLRCESELALSIRPNGTQPVEKAFWGRVPIVSGYSWLRFNSSNRTRDLLHAIKYEDDPLLGVRFGERFARGVAKVMDDPPDVLLPVPLHPKKLKKRGFNQAESIAIGFGNVLELPVNRNALKRTAHSGSLTMLSRIDRWERIKAMYEVADALDKHLHYMVIDDVITTGATIEACVRALQLEGVRRVSVASLAYAERQF